MQHNEVIRTSKINGNLAVLRHVTNYTPTGVKENSFWILEYKRQWDYPVFYARTEHVGFDNPAAFPKKVLAWTTKTLQNIAKVSCI